MWNNDCFWCGCECSTWSEELGSCRHQSVSTQQAQVEQTERERVSHSFCCLPERGKKKNHYQWFSRMTPLWQILSWNPPRAPGPLPSPQLLQFIFLLLHTKVCWLLPPLIISWSVRIPIRGQQTINNQAGSLCNTQHFQPYMGLPLSVGDQGSFKHADSAEDVFTG